METNRGLITTCEVRQITTFLSLLSFSLFFFTLRFTLPLSTSSASRSNSPSFPLLHFFTPSPDSPPRRVSTRSYVCSSVRPFLSVSLIDSVFLLRFVLLLSLRFSLFLYRLCSHELHKHTTVRPTRRMHRLNFRKLFA